MQRRNNNVKEGIKNTTKLYKYIISTDKFQEKRQTYQDYTKLSSMVTENNYNEGVLTIKGIKIQKKNEHKTNFT